MLATVMLHTLVIPILVLLVLLLLKSKLAGTSDSGPCVLLHNDLELTHDLRMELDRGIISAKHLHATESSSRT